MFSDFFIIVLCCLNTKFIRITSYNVCYTKLLRKILRASSRLRCETVSAKIFAVAGTAFSAARFIATTKSYNFV